MASWGNLLFVSGVDQGIQVFEISFPDMQPAQTQLFNLVDRGIIPVTEPVMALTASDGKIYAATGKEIKVFDVSDPSMASEMTPSNERCETGEKGSLMRAKSACCPVP